MDKLIEDFFKQISEQEPDGFEIPESIIIKDETGKEIELKPKNEKSPLKISGASEICLIRGISPRASYFPGFPSLLGGR